MRAHPSGALTNSGLNPGGGGARGALGSIPSAVGGFEQQASLVRLAPLSLGGCCMPGCLSQRQQPRSIGGCDDDVVQLPLPSPTTHESLHPAKGRYHRHDLCVPTLQRVRMKKGDLNLIDR